MKDSLGTYTKANGAAQSVRIFPTARGLEIRDPNDQLMLALWAWRDLVAVSVEPKQPLVLACRQETHARLDAPPQLRRILGGLAPQLFKLPRQDRLKRTLQALAVVIVLGLGSVFVIQWRNAGDAAHGVSLLKPSTATGGGASQKAHGAVGTGAVNAGAGEAGAAAASANRLPADACPDAGGQNALDVLMARLHVGGLRAAVLDSSAIAAFVRPGGVIVSRGLVAALDSADELAAVLAHESAHAILGHGAGSANPAYSPAEEAAAEGLAAKLLDDADLGTDGLGSFFPRLEGHDAAGAVRDLVRNHPNTLARAQAAMVRPVAAPALDPAQFKAVKGMCAR